MPSKETLILVNNDAAAQKAAKASLKEIEGKLKAALDIIGKYGTYADSQPANVVYALLSDLDTWVSGLKASKDSSVTAAWAQIQKVIDKYESMSGDPGKRMSARKARVVNGYLYVG